MGMVLEAECPCGYVGRSVLGAGMGDFDTSCAGPALCTMCASVVTVELMDTPPLCPDCQWEAISYDNRAVQDLDNASGEYPLASWNLPDGRSFTLPGGARYVCPQCTQATMTFEVVILFD
jgi:hypothetical protein